MEVVGSVFTGIVGKSISCCSSFLLSIDTIDFRYFDISLHFTAFDFPFNCRCFVFIQKPSVCTVPYWWDCCVRIFFSSGFAVFYSVIFRLFGIVLKHCNICFHLCICLPCFRMSFPCIFYLFSIVFVYVICSLKFRRFRLSCFTMCAHCLYIHRFRCFSAFVLSFFPHFISSFFLFFHPVFPSSFVYTHKYTSMCLFFFFSALLDSFVSQSCISIAQNKSIYIFVDYSVISSASERAQRHSTVYLSFAFSMCSFWLC